MSEAQTLLVGSGILFVFFAIIGAVVFPRMRENALGRLTRIGLGAVGAALLGMGIFWPSIAAPMPDQTPAISPGLASASTPSPTPLVRITSPREGEPVPFSTIVSGTVRGAPDPGRHLWVVINPLPSPGEWWPQGRIDSGDVWNVQARLGREKEDVGNRFDIAVISVNEKDDQYCQNYMQVGQATRNWPSIPLPTSATIIDRITVTRK